MEWRMIIDPPEAERIMVSLRSARKKWHLKGSMHADILYRFQVSAQPLAWKAASLIEKETLALGYKSMFSY